jgi:PAS domain-containing protein
VVGLIVYLLTCGFIIGIGEAMRAAKARANQRRETHRRDAQEKAEELSDARQLASIVEHSGDAIIGKSLDGTIQSWNDAAERVFGYTAAEAVGRHISLVIPPDRRPEEEQIITTLAAGQRIDPFETSASARRPAHPRYRRRLADKRRRRQHRGLFQGRPRRHPPAAGRRARAEAAGRRALPPTQSSRRSSSRARCSP